MSQTLIEIKNDEMIQSFIVERSWNLVFVEEDLSAPGDSEKRRCFRRFDYNHKDHKTHALMTERKGGNVKQHGVFLRLIR